MSGRDLTVVTSIWDEVSKAAPYETILHCMYTISENELRGIEADKLLEPIPTDITG
jgi:hypothetical protein